MCIFTRVRGLSGTEGGAPPHDPSVGTALWVSDSNKPTPVPRSVFWRVDCVAGVQPPGPAGVCVQSVDMRAGPFTNVSPRPLHGEAEPRAGRKRVRLRFLLPPARLWWGTLSCSRTSKVQSGLPGNSEGIFVRAGEENIFNSLLA